MKAVKRTKPWVDDSEVQLFIGPAVRRLEHKRVRRMTKRLIELQIEQFQAEHALDLEEMKQYYEREWE